MDSKEYITSSIVLAPRLSEVRDFTANKFDELVPGNFHMEDVLNELADGFYPLMKLARNKAVELGVPEDEAENVGFWLFAATILHGARSALRVSGANICYEEDDDE